MEPIRVMLVDDEQLVRVGLRSTVDWEGCGMTVVADAPNGEKAWEHFLQLRPEVVITDIVMPQMDGLELASKIKSEAPLTKILFLSCHRDFDYARQGIQLGASGYILKTSFDDVEMQQNLSRIRKTIEAERVTFADMDETPDNRWFTDPAQPMPDALKQRVEALFDHDAKPSAYLFPAHVEPEMLRQSAEALGGIYLKQGLLGCAIIPSSHRSFEGKLASMRQQDPDWRWFRSGTLSSAGETASCVRRLVRLHSIAAHTDAPVAECSHSIQDALLLIHDAVDRRIAAGDVALHAHVSRTHFSVQFKKETGYKVQSYILSLKLIRAKALLADTAWKTNEIAEAIGISDSKHFSKWFKKSTGKTPSEYRELTKSH